MTDIDPKEVFRQIGIDLINEYRQQRGLRPIQFLDINTPEVSAFIRSIQLHEKTKQELADCKQELSDFRQEVGDAVIAFMMDKPGLSGSGITHFVTPKPKPDPLVSAVHEVDTGPAWDSPEDYCNKIRAALKARGLEIREKSDE